MRSVADRSADRDAGNATIATPRIAPGALSMLIHGAGLFMRLVFMVLLLTLSSSTVLGYYGLFTAIEVVTIYIAGFEFHAFTTRRYARHPTARQLGICAAAHRRMLTLSAPLAAVLGIGALIFFEVRVDTTELAAFAVIVATGTVAQEVIRYMVLVQKPAHSVLLAFIRTAAWQPFVLPFIASERATVRAILLAWATMSLLGTGWGLWTMRAALRARSAPRVRYLTLGLASSASYYAASGTSVLQGNLERFVLQLFLGPAAVGVFAFFQTLSNTLPALIQSALMNIFLARLLTDFGQRTASRMEYLHAAIRRSLRGSLLIALALCAGTFPLIHLTGKQEYMSFVWILPVLLVGQVMTTWTQPIQLALYGAHHDRLLVVLSVASLAASLVLNTVLVGSLGLSGAVAAAVSVYVGLGVTRWRLLRRLQARGML